MGCWHSVLESSIWSFTQRPLLSGCQHCWSGRLPRKCHVASALASCTEGAEALPDTVLMEWAALFASLSLSWHHCISRTILFSSVLIRVLASHNFSLKTFVGCHGSFLPPPLSFALSLQIFSIIPHFDIPKWLNLICSAYVRFLVF